MFGRKRRASDPFYAAINQRQLCLYQKYLDALFRVVDVENFTKWTNSNTYDRTKLKRDEKLIARVCREEAATYDLSADFLQTMIHQYFLADPSLRERYQGAWAETVAYDRDALRFFPEAKRVRRLLDANLKVSPVQEASPVYRLSA